MSRVQPQIKKKSLERKFFKKGEGLRDNKISTHKKKN